MSSAHFTSLSRDHIIRLVSAPDFFTKNPELQAHQPAVTECLAAYAASAKNSRCGCGKNTKTLIGCFEALLGQIESAKENNQKVVDDFVSAATGLAVGEKLNKVFVYYTKNNGTTSHRYEFVA